MLEGYTNQVPADTDNQYGDYSEMCKAFLSKLSDEQIEVLKRKYFYHVTNERHAISILQNGLNRESALNEDVEDFSFLESQYKKYGRSGDQHTFDSHIMGRGRLGEDRPIYLSTEPLASHYEIPERVKFLLRNLHLLERAPYTTQQEKQQCLNIMNKYKSILSPEENKIVVLKISSISPPLLDSLIGGNVTELSSERVEELFQYVQDFESSNYQIYKPILPKFIEESERLSLRPDTFDRAIFKGAGICFDENNSGTPVRVEMLTEHARKLYFEFQTAHNGRSPNQEELAKLL